MTETLRPCNRPTGFQPEELATLPEPQRILETALRRSKFIARSVRELANETGLTETEVEDYCERSAHIARSPFRNARRDVFYGYLARLLEKYRIAPDGNLVESFAHVAPSRGPRNAPYHYFVSHASEDKQFVGPLVSALKRLGVKVWYDELEVRPGDSLRRKIDEGLSQCRYGIVVLSSAFFSKPWTNWELDGLLARMIGEEFRVIPIWHRVTQAEVLQFSPPLADRVALLSDVLSTEEIAAQLASMIGERDDDAT